MAGRENSTGQPAIRNVTHAHVHIHVYTYTCMYVHTIHTCIHMYMYMWIVSACTMKIPLVEDFWYPAFSNELKLENEYLHHPHEKVTPLSEVCAWRVRNKHTYTHTHTHTHTFHSVYTLYIWHNIYKNINSCICAFTCTHIHIHIHNVNHTTHGWFLLGLLSDALHQVEQQFAGHCLNTHRQSLVMNVL